MRLIVAYIRPVLEEEVVSALRRVPGITGATLTDARGFGHLGADAPASELLLGTTKRLRVEVLVPDEQAEAVVAALVASAHTGEPGDGRIGVLNVGRAVDITARRELGELSKDHE